MNKIINNIQNKTKYKFFPKNKEELQKIIDSQIHNHGIKVDLNDIDTSKITDMS